MYKIIFAIAIFAISNNKTIAQNYKLTQETGIMGMKNKSTIMVKGMRKRTEEEPMIAGMGANITTLLQCDLQRTIKINDKKKQYCIIPFSKTDEEIFEEEEKPTAKPKTVPVKPKAAPLKRDTIRRGGTIYMYNNIIDTGERKQMYGFTARHIWTVMKMKPSDDACSMKDSMLIKTDGWYIDFPKFNCPVEGNQTQRNYLKQMNRSRNNEEVVDTNTCFDRFVTRNRGKGRLGFPLIETRTMVFNGQQQEMSTTINTAELSTAKLDSMLFEIPLGYTQVKNESDLEEKMDIGSMFKNLGNIKNIANEMEKNIKDVGTTRIGIYLPEGEGDMTFLDLQKYLADNFSGNKIDAIAISNANEATKYKCDYTLNTNFTSVAKAKGLGGVLKAIKNADPNALSSYKMEAEFVLKSVADGSNYATEKVDGKYDGKPTEAAQKLLADAINKLKKKLK